MTKPKIVVYDFEFNGVRDSRNRLKIYPGYLIAFAWKELGEKKVHYIDILDYPGKTPIDDSKLVKKIGEVLDTVDLHICHYGDKCELPFIRTRLLKHGYTLLADPANTVDTCKIAQQKLSLKSNSLKTVAEFFGLKEHKYEITHEEWLLAFTGYKPIFKKIKARCKSDVRLCEQVYLKERPLITNHPAIQNHKYAEGVVSKKPIDCVCGSTKFKTKGLRHTNKGTYRRYYCKSCYMPHNVSITREVNKIKNETN